MIAYLFGKIILKKDKFIILEVNNVGYKVFLSRQTLLRLPEIGVNINLFCFQNIREDVSDLYGFLSYEELEFFETLNGIRGVGPKAALEISVIGPLEKIKDKILKQDENVFAGIPGIGQKRAMAIILELTGKIKTSDQKSSLIDEAESALMQLGFLKQQAKQALAQIPKEIKDPEEKIKQALKILGKG
ncbi:MAG: Holliday junction branch migration protein RuvA [Candidatus Staskawiczbacteria bacterium]|nr:Holliday junction branch migration protein RuvA [Candidatus Staskawiczbacteria bacterium]